MLSNIIFYHKGAVRVRYGTHEPKLGSWDGCKSVLIILLGMPVSVGSLRRKGSLRSDHRRQPNCTSATSDVLALCIKLTTK